MARFTFVLGILFTALYLFPGAAAAQEYNHIITVYAQVPEQRIIYLDKTGGIIKIAGNTENNITPAVMDADYKQVDLSPSVLKQYYAFLKLHNNRLLAGKVYKVNPLTVDNSPNNQSVTVENGNLSLGTLLIN